ncbi:uncharacterized protein isoform X2 [Takifugu rubripes]|uniref:uncharacterized protein isoform X2 n=1 Tax=Takifugu rubripes TaxID=31033 RepID=UPI0011458CAD|nr:uncharacterized protein LOC115248334 isoform X2 [Takifugu rubripes]
MAQYSSSLESCPCQESDGKTAPSRQVSSHWTPGPPTGRLVLPLDVWSSHWTSGPPTGRLVLPLDAWSSHWTSGPPTGRLVLPLDVWSSHWTSGPPTGRLVLPLDVWSSHWTPGPPTGRLVLPLDAWSSHWTSGPPTGRLDASGVPSSCACLVKVSSLRPVSCPVGMTSVWVVALMACLLVQHPFHPRAGGGSGSNQHKELRPSW